MCNAKSLPIFLFLFAVVNIASAQSSLLCAGASELGCNSQPKYSDGGEIGLFVRTHRDNLARDIAKGHGAHLSAFAELLGIARLEQISFAVLLQRNYTELFQSSTDSAQQWISRMVGVLSANNLSVRPTR